MTNLGDILVLCDPHPTDKMGSDNNCANSFLLASLLKCSLTLLCRRELFFTLSLVSYYSSLSLITGAYTKEAAFPFCSEVTSWFSIQKVISDD